MYQGILILHKLLMWGLLALFIFNIYNFFSKKSSNKEWDEKDTKISKILVILFDIQLTIGIILHLFISPITKSAFSAGSGMMKDQILRFYTIEHPFAMLIALGLVHIGFKKIKKKESSADKFKTGLIYFSVAFILVLVRVPWDKVI